MNKSNQFKKLDKPQLKGDASEALFKAEFKCHGYPVLVPECDNLAYDFVVESNGSFFRIQVKTAHERKENAMMFYSQKTRVVSDGYERSGYDGLIDYFAVYYPKLDKYLLVPLEEAPKTSMMIRYGESKNGQTKNINWIEDYLLQNQLENI